MRYCSFSALKLQGIAGGPLPGKNVASSLLDDRTIIRLVVKVMRFIGISLQVVEFIQILISQAAFLSLRGDYHTGRFIHSAFNFPARREHCSFHHLETIGAPLDQDVSRCNDSA